MKKEIFKQLIIDSQERKYAHVKERNIVFPKNSKKIIAITGVRRSGKTHLMFDTIKNLRKNINPQNIVYINFEDDRIFPLTLKELGQFPDVYYELFPNKKNEKVWFFFDEIQNIENWEKFIRRLYDTENCMIFISGSSSKLLSSEIATSLRGRTLTFEVFPLSFSEYLYFNNIEINYYSSKNKAEIINAFNNYLKTGGFPELLYNDNYLNRQILQEYIDLIIYKDMIERYKIGNYYLMKLLVKYSFTNISTLVSFNKLFNEFRFPHSPPAIKYD